MKKLFIIICALFIGVAYADNVITSKEYVDTQGATLQPQVQAKNTNTVLTYPAAGMETPGEKAIYDSSAAYATQSDALVTAGQFNNALQVALDTEFVCVSRNDQGCLLYEITAQKNLFRGPYVGALTTSIVYMPDGHYYDQITSQPYNPYSWFKGPMFIATIEPSATYNMTGQSDSMYGHYSFYASESDITDPTKAISTHGFLGDTATITAPDNATCLVMKFTNGDTTPITWSNVRLTKVSNNYMPTGN